MSRITRDTPWRDVGPLPYESWHDDISDAGGRAELASRAAWMAANPHSAILKRLLRQESSYDTDYNKNALYTNNPYNIRVPDRSNEGNPKGYVAYPNLVVATDAARRRISGDAGFFEGPNPYAATVTIEDLVYTYAPPKDPITGVIWNDTERLVREMERDLNVWLPNWSPPVFTPSTPEEPIPEEGEPMPLDPEILKPDFVDAYVTKRSDRQGFNFGTRGPIDLLFVHERQGRIGTAKAGQRFFACLTDTSCNTYGICSDGERCQDALVDWEILRDGTLVQYQDPYDTNRIPWASGGAENNSNAIGRAINAKYRGVFGGVNKVGAAVEIEKTDGEPCTPAQIQTAGRLMAYVMAKRGYPANDWEYPDVLGGNIYTVPNHGDVSQTSCRIDDSDKNAMKAVCSKALAAFYQGTSPGEEPQPEPPKPIEEIIPGLDYSVAARLFGTAKGEDGVTYKFDKNGPVSKLWLAEGKATGEWPALTAVYSYSDGRRYFVFDGGDTVIAVKGQEPRWLKEAA